MTNPTKELVSEVLGVGYTKLLATLNTLSLS